MPRLGGGMCGRRQAGPGAPSAGAGPPAAPSAVAYRQTAVDCRLDYLAMSRLSYSMYAMVDAAPPPAAEFGEAPGTADRGNDEAAAAGVVAVEAIPEAAGGDVGAALMTPEEERVGVRR